VAACNLATAAEAFVTVVLLPVRTLLPLAPPRADADIAAKARDGTVAARESGASTPPLPAPTLRSCGRA
jgi:hypothetical protein